MCVRGQIDLSMPPGGAAGGERLAERARRVGRAVSAGGAPGGARAPRAGPRRCVAVAGSQTCTVACAGPKSSAETKSPKLNPTSPRCFVKDAMRSGGLILSPDCTCAQTCRGWGAGRGVERSTTVLLVQAQIAVPVARELAHRALGLRLSRLHSYSGSHAHGLANMQFEMCDTRCVFAL